MKPIIALTGNPFVEDGNPHIRLSALYADAARAAGGLPFLAMAGQAEDIAAACDGLFLPGGVDIDPVHYGQSVCAPGVEINAARDAFELALFHAFKARTKPIFGVCRGIQVINVASGGTLVQDLPAQQGLRHSWVTHALAIAPGCFLEGLPDRHCPVNSFHHQAIDAVAPGFIPLAHAPDGVVEAIAHETLPIWGVQWHPERPQDSSQAQRQFLLERFVEQCRKACGKST